MKSLIITEKPSVARDISNVLGGFTQHENYFESEQYIISWCFGHLVGLAPMDAYDETLKKWSLDTLPFIPKNWKTQLIESSKSQFYVLKELMNRSDVHELICCTDAGREGQYIFGLVVEQAKCLKPAKRLWISSFEDHVIRDGFANLHDNADYQALLDSAKCRARADWLVGLNLTRAMTKKYGNGHVLSIGRVQTPTLEIVLKRDEAIANFEPVPYYIVTCHFDGFTTQLRLDDEQQLNELMPLLKTQPHLVKSLETSPKKQKVPELFDLTALQKACNQHFNLSAQQTLDIAQKLYEKKYLSYPRTDSKAITQSQANNVMELIQKLCQSEYVKIPTFDIQIHQIINDAGVSDHHALLPTLTALNSDWSTLTDEERHVLLLVCYQLLIAVAPAYQYESTKLVTEVAGYDFSNSTTRIVNLGFRAIEHARAHHLKLKQKSDEAKIFPALSIGQPLDLQEVTNETKHTKPPKAYTEATLLEAMERADLDDKEAKATLKQVGGIGRPSTRANIIETLIRMGYLERDKNNLVSTDKAKILRPAIPEALKSAKLTADWEMVLDDVAKGQKAPEMFINEISQFVTDLVKHEKQTIATFQLEPKVNQASQKEVIATCPTCQSSFFESEKNYYCSNRECKTVLFKENKYFEKIGFKLTKGHAKNLLTNHQTPVELVSKKTNKPYNAILTVQWILPYPKFNLEFPKKRVSSAVSKSKNPYA